MLKELFYSYTFISEKTSTGCMPFVGAHEGKGEGLMLTVVRTKSTSRCWGGDKFETCYPTAGSVRIKQEFREGFREAMPANKFSISKHENQTNQTFCSASAVEAEPANMAFVRSDARAVPTHFKSRVNY